MALASAIHSAAGTAARTATYIASVARVASTGPPSPASRETSSPPAQQSTGAQDHLAEPLTEPAMVVQARESEILVW